MGDVNEVVKKLFEKDFDLGISSMLESGKEYKEIYDKKSDYAKQGFFGFIASRIPKDKFNEILRQWERVEKYYKSGKTN